MKSRTGLSLLTTLLLTLPGCAPRIESADLYGTYVAEYAFGQEAISLESNGTFRQEVVIAATRATHTGNWKYNGGRVILEGCLVVSNGFGELNKDYAVPQSGLCIFPIERSYLWAGDIRFGSGAGHPHIKQGQR
jgi:hypothetical protein